MKSQLASARHLPVLDVDGRFATLRPAPKRVMGRLAVPSHDLARGQNGSVQIARERLRLYNLLAGEESPDGGQLSASAAFPSGLAPVVHRILDIERIPHDHLSRGLAELGEPTFGWAYSGYRLDQELLEFVSRDPGGLVLYRPGRVRPTNLIAQTARAFPDAKIVIATRHIQVARRCAKLLRRHFPETRLLIDTWEPCEPARIVVGLYDKLGFGAVRLGERDIFIASKADEVISKIGNTVFEHIERARIFGFLPWNAHLAPADEGWLGQWFGVKRLVIPEHGHRFRDVEFAFVRNVVHTRIDRSVDNFTLRRQAIWNSDRRNVLVSEIALALRHQKRNSLEKHLPAVLPLLPTDRKLGVLVIAQAQEHVDNLLRHLAGWGSDAAIRRGFDPSNQNLQPEGPPFIPGASVIEPSRISQYLLKDIDVIVRADGAAGGLPLPLGALVDPVTQRRRLLIVDLNDRGHPILRRWTRERREAYLQVGWYEAGVDRDAQDADRWIRTSES